MLKKAAIPDWRGHPPATSAVLLELFERAAAGAIHFSLAERVLATACEFWAAAKNRTLSVHLGDTAIDKLQAAEVSFAAIGLVNIVPILLLGRIDLTRPNPPVSLHIVAGRIEDALSRTAEPVDELIAEFAREKTRVASLSHEVVRSLETAQK
jgi:hypothetical protein